MVGVFSLSGSLATCRPQPAAHRSLKNSIPRKNLHALCLRNSIGVRRRRNSMDSFTSAITRRLALTLLAGAVAFIGETCLRASNHLDSPTAIANPQADIGDFYAWITSD